MLRIHLLVLVAALILPACSGEDSGLEDSGLEDSGLEDSGLEDSGLGDRDVAPDDDVSCETDCPDGIGLSFDTGARLFPFSQAAFGLSAPAQTESGQWEIYIEAWEGGFTGCPREDSPTPSRTLILSGLPVFEENETYGEDDGIALVLLDYDGEIITTENPFSRALTLTIRPVSWDACLNEGCEAAPGVVAVDPIVIDVAGSFAEGELGGRLEAEHCESLDLR